MKHSKESKLYHTAWTQIWIPAHREVELEHSADRETNRTSQSPSEPLLIVSKLTVLFVKPPITGENIHYRLNVDNPALFDHFLNQTNKFAQRHNRGQDPNSRCHA